MMKTKTLFSLILTLFVFLPMSAQEKLFTLEDLNYGGNNYRNLQPENKWYTWWGDELVRTDVEDCFLVEKSTGRQAVRETKLFTLEEINKWIGSDDDKYVRDGKKSVSQYISQEDPVNGKYIYFQPKVQYKAGENQQQYIAGFSYFLAGNEDAMANTYGNNYEFMQTFAKENGFELLMDGDEPFTTMSDSASEMTLTTTWRDVEGYPMDTYNFDMVHTMEKGNVIQQPHYSSIFSKINLMK